MSHSQLRNNKTKSAYIDDVSKSNEKFELFESQRNKLPLECKRKFEENKCKHRNIL